MMKIIQRKYDQKGMLRKETLHIEEDINEVKKRNHMGWEIYNRRIDAFDSGFLMS